jgi:hypothetical protein
VRDGGVERRPRPVTPMKWARSNSWSAPRRVRICDSASAPVMKNQLGGRFHLVAQVAQGRRCGCCPERSMSTRLTENRGFDAVAITVIR